MASGVSDSLVQKNKEERHERMESKEKVTNLAENLTNFLVSVKTLAGQEKPGEVTKTHTTSTVSSVTHTTAKESLSEESKESRKKRTYIEGRSIRCQ